MDTYNNDNDATTNNNVDASNNDNKKHEMILKKQNIANECTCNSKHAKIKSTAKFISVGREINKREKE